MHSSTNNFRTPRVIANPNIQLRQPMDLSRPEDELSLLERVTRDWIREGP